MQVSAAFTSPSHSKLSTMNPKQAQIFSFFSGAGFLDLGFEHEEFETVFVNEFYEPFFEGYSYARKQLQIPTPVYGQHIGSITDLLGGEDAQKLSAKVAAARASGSPVGFIGGPPCPDFSVGGKNRGGEGENGKLTQSYADLITQQLPDFFVFENVKGLWRTKLHREFYEHVKAQLAEAGYVMTERLTNAIEFGVAQDRDRIILLGFRTPFLEQLASRPLSPLDATSMLSNFPWTAAIKYEGRSAFALPWPKTSAFAEDMAHHFPEGIPKELTVQFWFDRNKVTEHPNAKHGFKPRAGLKRFLLVEEGDDSRKSFKRLHRWRYSPTAAYGNNEVHLHPYKARRLTVSEVLAIQALPPEFELPSTMSLTDMFKTAGNGVPYLMARGLATSLKSFFTSVRAEQELQAPNSQLMGVAD